MMRWALVLLLLGAGILSEAHAAPCYGTRMPEKNKLIGGFEHYTIIERDLENGKGTVRSSQNFMTLSYGICDWLSVDLKGGGGAITQESVAGDEVNYDAGFAGGYGLRMRLYEAGNIKSVIGFEHISVHPRSSHVRDVKNKAVLDDWQVSVLASYSFSRLTPYAGARWSRVDYIHWIEGERKRVMSDMTRDIGLIAGVDISITPRVWINIEGQFMDSQAVAASAHVAF